MSDDRFSFQSERDFHVAAFTRSHGMLLLMSQVTDASLNRQEVLFTDVRAMDMRFHIAGGLHIEEVGPDYLEGRSINASDLQLDGDRYYDDKIFAVRANGWDGHIIAYAVWMQEVDGPLDSPQSYYATFQEDAGQGDQRGSFG